MLVVVFSVSTCVHLYSFDYMGQDPHFLRFLSYLSLFTFFMIILITAGNFIQLFMGWEGVGLCSYLLINFWNQRLQANKAALKAMFLNRIADVFLAVALFLIYYFFLTVDYNLVFALNLYASNVVINLLGFSFNLIDIITLFFVVGAMGKSAQIGLHTWLPDAMEGPTPVSALIHAATMVTAGIFLLVRSSSLIELSSFSLIFISILGVLTAFMAGTIGVFQNDIKRIIAYSTCSQLGYMMFVCGFSNYSASMFHLSNHAFFKAALFLGAGCVIHSMLDEQDLRKYGSLESYVPLGLLGITISGASLAGNPYLTGSFSKDFIIELSYVPFTSLTLLVSLLATLTVLFTAYYSDIIETAFEENPDGFRKYYLNSHENSFFMNFPLLFLTLGGIFLGFLVFDLNVGLGNNFYLVSNYSYYSNDLTYQIETLYLWIYLLPFFCGFLGSIGILILESNLELLSTRVKEGVHFFLADFVLYTYVYNFFNRKWLFDKIYNQNISVNFLQMNYKYSYQFIDRGFLEFFGPWGLYNILKTNFMHIVNKWFSVDINSPRFLFELLVDVLLILFILSWIFFII